MPAVPSSVDRAWLEDFLGGEPSCASSYDAAVRVFGDSTRVSRDLVRRAEALGLDVGWAGLRLLDDAGQQAFIDFTVTRRRASLEALDDPGDDPIAARCKRTVTRELERDGGEFNKGSAYKALLSCLRASSYAGGSHRSEKEALLGWIMDRLNLPETEAGDS